MQESNGCGELWGVVTIGASAGGVEAISQLERYIVFAEEAERALAVLSARLAAVSDRHEGNGD